MSTSLTLERYGYSACESSGSELSPVTQEMLIETVRMISREPSATLTVGVGGSWLSVSASSGLLTVGVQLGDEEALNLVGNTAATGFVTFVLGGQEGEFPRRYLVDLEQASAAALYFLNHASVDRSGEYWDRQGENDAWQQEGIG